MKQVMTALEPRPWAGKSIVEMFTVMAVKSLGLKL